MNPITVQDLLEAGKHASLTGSVLTEWAEKDTPKQREYLHGCCWLNTNPDRNPGANGC